MVHLHIRSAYTLLKSTLSIERIVSLCSLHGIQAACLCDFQVLHGAIKFIEQCKKANIHPIIGMEVLVEEDDKTYGFYLLARNHQGYQDLCVLSTALNKENAPSLSMEELMQFSKNLFVIASFDDNTLEQYLLQENTEALTAFFHQAKACFNNFFAAIERNDSPLIRQKNQILKNAAQQCNVKTTAISRIYYGNEQEEEAYRCLCAMDQGLQVYDKNLKCENKRYFRNADEMKSLYDEDDLQMCVEIAKNCHVTLDFEKATLPKFENKYNLDSEEFLRRLCHQGLIKRMNQQKPPYMYEQRLKYELDVITSMGFSDYFLIVYDFIRYARSKDIQVGAGRGSAAGSLVAYCLGITHVDPLKYNLLFERFLNPERISMPDIDVDFPDHRRDEVIEYVMNRYGKDRVAHIVTFNTLGAKQVLRDVGKAYGAPSHQIDLLCRLVGNKLKVTLQDAMNQPRFAQMVASSRQLTQVFKIALQLEGLPRHTSLHAAGIVLSKDPITRVAPLMEVEDNGVATQYTMEHLESLGLIKMDFLGLRNLSIIEEILNEMKKCNRYVDIMRLPLQDKKTFELLQKVDTNGIFQLESEGMKNLLRKLKPRTFEDIVAAIALFRPGPMENIPEYLKRRNDPSCITYPHHDLEPILASTYGIMIYQEQIMQVVQKMAGFTLSKADILRKAISKKKGTELEKLRNDFISGSISKGYSQQLAEHVYDLIMKFANYGFNRSHSVAYGYIAYQLAYLKANEPLFFFQSLLNGVIGIEVKTSAYVFEARKHGIRILPPSIQVSGYRYQIEGNAIRMPLSVIKGFGVAAVNEVMEERNIRGPFTDFAQAIARIGAHKISRKQIESLIYAGALDGFRANRSSMLATLDAALTYGGLIIIDKDPLEFDYDLMSKPIMMALKDFPGQNARREKEAFGFYLDTHPVSAIRPFVNKPMHALITLPQAQGNYVGCLAMITKTKQHKTKKGDLMMFVTAEDESGMFDFVVMPNLYQMYQEKLVKDAMIYFEGFIDKETSMLVKKIQYFDEALLNGT